MAERISFGRSNMKREIAKARVVTGTPRNEPPVSPSFGVSHHKTRLYWLGGVSLGVLACFMHNPAAVAATANWTGNGDNIHWTDPTNFDATVTSNDVVIHSGITTPNVTVNGLGFSGAGTDSRSLTINNNSTLTDTGNLNVGTSASGTAAFITVQGGASISVTGNAVLGQVSGATGILNIGSASGSAATASGAFSAASISFGPGTGIIEFNHTDANYTFSTNITSNSSAPGSVVVDAGTTNLSGTNTYFGTTTINGGTLKVGSTTGFSANSAFTVGAAGTVDLNGFSNSVGSLAGAAGAIVTNSGAAATLTAGADGTSTTYAGVLQNGAGTLSLVKTGGGTLTLTGANTYTGGTTLTTGKVQVGVATVGAPGAITSSAIGTGTLTFNGGTLQAGGAFTIANAGAINSTGGTIDANGNTFTMSGIIANGNTATGTLTIVDTAGGGTVVLSGANTYAGPTNVTSGTLAAGIATQAFGIGSAVTVGASGTLDLAGFSNTIGSLAGAAGAIVTNSNVTAATLTAGSNNTNTTYAGLLQNGAGTLSLVKTGGGILTLTGANTYTGGTTLTSGKVQVGVATVGTPGAITSSAIGRGTLTFNGGTLQAGGAFTIANAGAINSTGGTIDANGQTLTMSGVIANGNTATGILTIVDTSGGGAGKVVLSGANTYAGGTILTSGKAQVGVATVGTPGAITSSAIGTGTLTFNGGTLQAGGAFTIANAGAINSAGGTIDANGQTFTMSGVVANGNTATGILTIVDTSGGGAGKVVLSGANTYAGGTILTSGKAQVGVATVGTPGAITSSAIGTGTLTFNGGTLQAGGAFTIANAGAINLAGGTIDANGQTITMSGVIANGNSTTGTLTIADTSGGPTGKVVLAGNNTYSGPTKINAGVILNANSSAALGNGSSTNTLIFNGGTLQAGGAIASPNTRGVTLTGAGTIDTNGNAVSIAGIISGAGALTISGGGTATFAGTNTYSSATTITGVTLNANSSAALGDGSATNTLIFNNGTLRAAGTITSPSTRGVILSGPGTIDTNGNAVSIAGVVTGAGNFTKSGTGTLTLTGTNTNSGTVTIAAGTLNANSSAALGDGSATNTLIFNGGTLQAGGAITSLNTRGVTLTGAGTIDTNGNAVSIGGVIAGAGNFTKLGAGTLTLTGTNTNSGTVTITAGTLNANASAALGDGSATNTLVFNGGTLQAGGAITSPSSRGVTLTGAGTIDTNGNAVSIGGVITGAGAFTKTGTGTLTLTGINSYTGLTTVSAGTLVNGGAIAGNVANNNTFTNTGTLAGRLTNAVTAFTSGTISGGVVNTGTLTASAGVVNGAIANDAGGIFKVTGTVTSNSTFTNAGSASLLVDTGGGYTVAGAITNAGTVAVNTLGTLTANKGVVNSGNVTVNAGGTLTATGITNQSGGTIINNGTVNDDLTNAGTVTNNGTYTATVASNTGTITNSTSGTWNGDVVDNSGTIANAGTWKTTGGGFVTSGTLNTTNTLNVSLGGLFNTGTVNARGTINGAVANNAGTFTVTGTLGGNSTFDNAAGATLAVNSESFTGTTTLTNEGTLTVGSGGILSTVDGLTNTGTVNAQGTINGSVTNTAGSFNVTGDLVGNSTFDNQSGATLNVGGNSYTGLTSLTNSGTVLVSNGGTLGAGAFNNAGTLNIASANGADRNQVTINGNYNAVGSNATVAVNVNFAKGVADDQRSDLLTINGTVSGTTNLAFSGKTIDSRGLSNLPAFTGTLIAPTPVIRSAGGDGTFTPLGTGGQAVFATNGGLVQYALKEVSPGNYDIVSGVNTAGIAPISTAISSAFGAITTSFFQSSSAFVTPGPNNAPGQWTGGPWIRVSEGSTTVDSSGRDTLLGTQASSKTDTNFTGFQAGVDSGAMNVQGSSTDYHVGLTTGVVSATTIETLGPSTKIDLSIPFVGVYGALKHDSFAADVTYRHDFADMTVKSLATDDPAHLKGDGDSVYGNLAYGFGFYGYQVIPSLGMGWSHYDISPLATNTGGTLTFSHVDSILGRLGVQVGRSFNLTERMVIQPFLTAAVWHEFEGDTLAHFTDPSGITDQVATTRVGTFEQVGVGISAQLVPAGFTSFIRGDFRFGDKLNGATGTAGVRYSF